MIVSFGVDHKGRAVSVKQARPARAKSNVRVEEFRLQSSILSNKHVGQVACMWPALNPE